MKYVCCLVVVSEIAKSLHLYRDILGCEIVEDYGENVVFKEGFALHDKNHFQKLVNREISTHSNSFELYFETEEILKIFNRIDQEGLEFVHKIEEQPWKQRVFRFYDCDGNMIEIGEPMQYVAFRLYKDNFDMAEISKITYLSEYAIRSAIEKYSE